MKTIPYKSHRFCFTLLLIAAVLFFNSCQFDRDEEMLKVSFTREGDIFTMDVNGEELKQLTFTGFTGPNGYNDSSSWSPDGSKIVFESNRTGGSEVFIMDSDGNNQKQLTYGTSINQKKYPTFMPDGKSIVYADSDPGTLVIIKTDGAVIKGIEIPAIKIAAISVSPDGKYIAVASEGSSQNSIGKITIATDEFETIAPQILSDLSWSPDGAYCVLINGGSLSLLDLSSGNITGIPNVPGSALKSPVWAPDSNYIYFTERNNICRITKTGLDFVQLTALDIDSNVCVRYKPR